MTKVPVHRRIVRHRSFVPILIFAIVLIVLFISMQFTDKPPLISSITPEVAFPGTVLIIRGENFGNERKGSEVAIAGARPTSTLYLEWTNDRISVRVPEDAGSGMVLVSTRYGRSDGKLFTNKNHIPIILSGPAAPGLPHIKGVDPGNGSVGSLITLTGLNFGLEQGKGTVLFTPISLPDEGRNIGESLPFFARASHLDEDYVIWSDQEVQVHVPEGASSGTIQIQTDHGMSNAVYFEDAGQVGNKLFLDKRGYQCSIGVRIHDVEGDGEGENAIDVWVPIIALSMEQRNIKSEYGEVTPLWEDYRGVNRFRFENLEPFHSYEIQQTFWFDRYAVQTTINPSKVIRSYNTERKFYKRYTAPDIIIPSDNPAIRSLSDSITRRQTNPYLKARDIFSWLVKNMTFNREVSSTGIITNLEKKKGDSYTLAVLFTALARGAGIPARPVAGYLVYNNKDTVKHYWAEFYLEAFGWVPVDPALAGGARFGDMPQVQDPVEYYFGNLDNHHISFSRGLIDLKPLTPGGLTVRRKEMYSFQTFHEEHSASIENYSVSWKDLRLIDIW
jgi:hypothetical protein